LLYDEHAKEVTSMGENEQEETAPEGATPEEIADAESEEATPEATSDVPEDEETEETHGAP
jgi:hypothetical protein